MPESVPDLATILQRLERLEAELEAAKAELARKDRIIAALQQRLFGSKSERLDPAQLNLMFEEALLGKGEPLPDQAAGSEEAASSGRSRRSRRAKAELYPRNLRIEIVFDPGRITYRDLLEFFFQIHDPTTRDRQGNDRGSSYRSAIYYVDDEQKRVAEETIADVDASGRWPGKVVTELEPVGDFWQAEPEHQDYLERYPGGYTCHFPRPDWVLAKRTASARSGGGG